MFHQYSTMHIPLIFFIFFLSLFISSIDSQNLSEESNEASSVQSPSGTNFQPSLAVVIGMLSIMFAVTFILLLYAKFCHREASIFYSDDNNHIRDGLMRRSRSSLVSGLEKAVIESLPIFRFSYLKGSKEGLECAVCLAKFEDVEVLRLLPKCKHAFHIGCIDQWLEKHSTCPLCRQNVSKDDVSELPYSNSLRFLWSNNGFNLNPSDLSREESNIELYVRREENSNNGNVGSNSSRFSVGGSFRKMDRCKKEDELPIVQLMENMVDCNNNTNIFEEEHRLHRFNHRIVVSDVVFKNRWSNVSSSDLMFLNSEMINDLSSKRFSSSFDLRNNIDDVKSNGSVATTMNLREEMGRKMMFESKVRDIQENDQRFRAGIQANLDSRQENNHPMLESRSVIINSNDKRCMSEIVVHPRLFIASSSYKGDMKDERRRRLWIPIARKTVKWFANRERRRIFTSSKSSNGRIGV